ncbi:Uu.00g133880.m01.CDS01 [Anthostomella pinea]|uniref:Uu.00g133880.m01.CDS01 n=1 Tax=Anthostomella pinea TaxID=933095 RepID=A0AAI8VPI1_9PEZI|nr:Uu.00g133880.m01.CDS01 [Anthostomella pinea]
MNRGSSSRSSRLQAINDAYDRAASEPLSNNKKSKPRHRPAIRLADHSDHNVAAGVRSSQQTEGSYKTVTASSTDGHASTTTPAQRAPTKATSN